MSANSILAATLIALVASATFAQAAMRSVPESLPQHGQIGDLARAPNVIWDVFVNGKYIGSDCDAIIRKQLMRDLTASE
jgi:hypothetical protein